MEIFKFLKNQKTKINYLFKVAGKKRKGDIFKNEKNIYLFSYFEKITKIYSFPQIIKRSQIKLNSKIILKKLSFQEFEDIVFNKRKILYRFCEGSLKNLILYFYYEEEFIHIYGYEPKNFDDFKKIFNKVILLSRKQEELFVKFWYVYITYIKERFFDNKNIMIAFKGWPDFLDNPFPYSFKRSHKVRFLNILSKITNTSSFYDGLFFKQLIIDKNFNLLIDKIKNKKIIIIANNDFKNLSIKLKNISHITIPYDNQLYLVYEDILKEINKELEKFKYMIDDIVLIFQTGSAFANYFMLNITKNYPDLIFLDLGQALNIILHSDEFHSSTTTHLIKKYSL